MGERIRLPFGAKGLFFRGDLFVCFREWIFLVVYDNISYVYHVLFTYKYIYIWYPPRDYIYIYMVTDTVIEFFLALQHARVPTAAGFSIISYSLKKMGNNSSAHFAILSLDSIIPLSCIFWGKPRFGLSIISWAKNGLNFL